jgi:hypothetical protein
MAEGYSQNVVLGLKLSPHPMPLILECPHLGASYTTYKEREKTMINKNQGWPSIKSTRQMRTQINTTQIKNKSKQSIKKNQVKTLCKEESQLKK